MDIVAMFEEESKKVLEKFRGSTLGFIKQHPIVVCQDKTCWMMRTEGLRVELMRKPSPWAARAATWPTKPEGGGGGTNFTVPLVELQGERFGFIPKRRRIYQLESLLLFQFRKVPPRYLLLIMTKLVDPDWNLNSRRRGLDCNSLRGFVW